MSDTVLTCNKPVARKDHTCYLCGRVIPKGEKHNQRSGVSYGEFWSIRCHVPCDVFAGRDYEWESHDAGEFRQAIEESEAAIDTDNGRVAKGEA